MRALFVQHDHVSPAGAIGARFSEHGYDVEELVIVPEGSEPGLAVEFPDPTRYDVIVPMGAPWSVYDHGLIGAWVLPELDFLRAAHDAAVPVLGICFGGQALAAALGGAVVPSAEAEVGWFRIETDEPGLVEAGPWFQWHHDRWEAPEGARTVARTPLADQAFVLGRSLAVQFHPELTPSMLTGWLGNGGRRYLRAHGLDGDALLDETGRQAARAEQRAHRLVDRFLDQVARRDVVTVTGPLSRYARAAEAAGRDQTSGDFTLEATETAVAERLQGLEVDVSAMAVVSNVYRAANAVRNHLERTVLAPHGLTWTGWVVLWVVWIWGDIETRHVAAEAGVSKGTLTGVQKTLVAKGMVDRTVHPGDGRRVLLSLTPKGERLMAELFPEFNSVEAWVTSDLDDVERLRLARSLRTVVKRVEQR